MSKFVPVSLPAGTWSLPPLGGRFLAAYRLLWWTLLAAAVAAATYALVAASAHPLVLTLRLAKSAVLVAVSTILFFRRRRDAVAAMLGLSFLLWTISSSVDFAGATGPLLLDRLRFLPFALALLMFPDGEWRPRRTGPVAAVIISVFLVGVAEALGLLATHLYLPLAIGCVLLALGLLLARYRSQSEVARQQLKWVMLGLVVGIGLILSARAGAAFAMPMSGRILLEGLFQLGIVVIALGFLTSLLRYRLYDAEAAISRSAIYAALTLSLVGTFAACEALIELLGQRYFGSSIGSVSGAVAAAVAAILLTPLHGRMSSWAEHYFQHDLAVLKQELPNLLTSLSAGASVKRLAGAVLPRIEQAVQSTRMALLLDGRVVAVQGIDMAAAASLLRGWNAPIPAGVVGRDENDPFPLRLPLRCPLGQPRGWLLLGPRPDGSFYGRDDIEALIEIAPPLQRTVILVAEREAVERRQRARHRSLARALTSLSDRLSTLEQHDRRSLCPSLTAGR